MLFKNELRSISIRIYETDVLYMGNKYVFIILLCIIMHSRKLYSYNYYAF